MQTGRRRGPNGAPVVGFSGRLCLLTRRVIPLGLLAECRSCYI